MMTPADFKVETPHREGCTGEWDEDCAYFTGDDGSRCLETFCSKGCYGRISISVSSILKAAPSGRGEGE